ncbi:hypothetical protein ACWCPF_26115 [Streptomyces sp. NPDC001858]
MTTTTDIARTHGHAGSTACQDCGTTDNLHLVVWGDPESGESGTFLECCGCGIAAGDPPEIHDDCEPDEPDEENEDPGPTARVFRREAGWTLSPALPPSQTPEPCTSNHFRQQDGRPACTAIAAWKVVEDHGMHLSIGFYCDADLPDEHKPQEATA